MLGAAVPVTGGLSIGGYLSVAIAQASAAGIATYAIGRSAKRYFENGASWGEAEPKVAIERIIDRSEEHTSELQSLTKLVCRLLLEKKKEEGCNTVTDKYRKLDQGKNNRQT